MPKLSTIRQWSEGRKKRVFQRRAATLTKDLVMDVSANEELLDLSRREVRLLSREIARDLLESMQSMEFIKSAGNYDENCSLDMSDVLPKVEEDVLSSMHLKADQV